MKNILLSLFFLGFLWAVSPENPVFQSDNIVNKGGCLDEDAINFCFDCNENLGTCLYDNETSRICEDARIAWKKGGSLIRSIRQNFKFRLTRNVGLIGK